jgi:Poly(R)-hydroxyalkanoic acid synthase subunit (PHA_synth_III_E)
VITLSRQKKQGKISSVRSLRRPETLQSEGGLAATAALIRADLAYRKKMQQVAAVFAEQFDMTSRRELDEAFREIQVLKRELRATRIADTEELIEAQRAPARKPRATKKKADKDD